MKILVVLTRFPWPLEKGDKLRAFHQIRVLSQNHEIFLAAISDTHVPEEGILELKKYCSGIKVFRIKKPAIIRRLLMGIASSLPFQAHYFFDRNIKKEFDHLRNQFNPAFEYYQLLRSALYAPGGRGTKVIDYMDALSAGMRKRSAYTSPAISWLWKMESKRLAAFESQIYTWFDHHTVISLPDAEEMDLPGLVEIVPNGTDLSLFEGIQDYYSPSGPVIFHGNMNYPPNEHAAAILAREIMPILRKTLPNRSLILSGATPSQSVKALADKYTKVTGWVESLHDVFKGASVFVAPFRIRTGLQNKLLEAMAAGIPCITSPAAARALGATEEQNILTAESPEEYVEKILKLVREPELAKKIITNAREFVSGFTWEEQTSGLVEIFGQKN